MRSEVLSEALVVVDETRIWADASFLSNSRKRLGAGRPSDTLDRIGLTGTNDSSGVTDSSVRRELYLL